MLAISNVDSPISAPIATASAATGNGQGATASADVHGVGSQSDPDLPDDAAMVRVAPGTADALLALGSVDMDDLVSAYLRDAVTAYAMNRE